MGIALQDAFEKFGDSDHGEFERVVDKRSNRPDLHAFLLLDEILPGKRDMVSAAEHDEIWLDVDCDALSDVVTEEQVLELVRCGVRYSEDLDSLAMFV